MQAYCRCKLGFTANLRIPIESPGQSRSPMARVATEFQGSRFWDTFYPIHGLQFKHRSHPLTRVSGRWKWGGCFTRAAGPVILVYITCGYVKRERDTVHFPNLTGKDSLLRLQNRFLKAPHSFCVSSTFAKPYIQRKKEHLANNCWGRKHFWHSVKLMRDKLSSIYELAQRMVIVYHFFYSLSTFMEGQSSTG
jgi:hypothetical protein